MSILIVIILFLSIIKINNNLSENDLKPASDINEGTYIISPYNSEKLILCINTVGNFIVFKYIDHSYNLHDLFDIVSSNRKNEFYIRKDNEYLTCDGENIRKKYISINETLNNKPDLIWKFFKIKDAYYAFNPSKSKYLTFTQQYTKYQTIRIANCTSFNEKLNQTFNIRWFNNKNINKNSTLLDNTPVDVIIKYIDLRDPSLYRFGLQQNKKDYDNQELRYCLRSILKNIPWVNKIFILMPNSRVLFLKKTEIIKDKIVYVKDEKMLGFSSTSSPTFEINLYKMKNFNVSNHVIYMNDDYFIGQPLKKSDFFYEDNGKIYPLTVCPIGRVLTKSSVIKERNSFINRYGTNDAHTWQGYKKMYFNSLLLVYTILNSDSIIESDFTHNAISLNLDDIKEIHDLTEKYYPKPKSALQEKYRSIDQILMQVVYINYFHNKYKRKSKEIESNFIDLAKLPQMRIIQPKPLFCINTGGDKTYSKSNFQNEKEYLEKLYPEPTIYEDPNFDEKTAYTRRFSIYNIIALFIGILISAYLLRRFYRKYLRTKQINDPELNISDDEKRYVNRSKYMNNIEDMNIDEEEEYEGNNEEEEGEEEENEDKIDDNKEEENDYRNNHQQNNYDNDDEDKDDYIVDINNYINRKKVNGGEIIDNRKSEDNQKNISDQVINLPN